MARVQQAVRMAALMAASSCAFSFSLNTASLVSRSSSQPALSSSRRAQLALRKVGGAKKLNMLQTFTEADTWKATDIPKLLKEAATHFLDDENVKFTPTSGGVNNLVQYVDTSDGQRYVMRIYNNGGNSVRVKYEHAVLKELNKQSMSFQVPNYVPSKKTGDTHILLSNGAEACMCNIIPGELPKSAEPASIGRAAGELLVALGKVKIDLKSPTPPYFDIYKVHHAISREKFFEEIEKPWAESCKGAMEVMVEEFLRIEKRLEELKQDNLPFQLM
eukprot:750228-Hanusia_phi.AAC.1